MLWKTLICSAILLLAVGEAARPGGNGSGKKDTEPKKDDNNFKPEKAEKIDYSAAQKAAEDAQRREDAWMKKYMVDRPRKARGYTPVPKA